MEEKLFQRGDLVRLKSGGPRMIVDRHVPPIRIIQPETKKKRWWDRLLPPPRLDPWAGRMYSLYLDETGVHCVWHDNQGRICTGKFRPELLELESPCRCRSYYERTGQHAEDCPMFHVKQ